MMVRTPTRSVCILQSLCLIWAASGSSGTTATAFISPPASIIVSSSRTAPLLHAVPKKKKVFTIKDLVEKIEKNPSVLTQEEKRKKYKRTRQRTDNPKQRYTYARQRGAKGAKTETESSTTKDEEGKSVIAPPDNKNNNNNNNDEFNLIHQARKLGMGNAGANQHCDAVVSDSEPKILGQIRVGDETGAISGTMAYVINKPVGWSILGGLTKKKESLKDTSGSRNSPVDVVSLRPKSDDPEFVIADTKNTVKVKDEDGKTAYLEVDEMDILSMMTPEERAEFEADGGLSEFGEVLPTQANDKQAKTSKSQAASPSSRTSTSSLSSAGRPSIVAWLKALKAAEGTPIRGGNYWTAVAGATSVDDTGLVVICPKDKVSNVFIDFAKYVAVVGNGKQFAPKSKTKDAEVPKEFTKMEIASKLRKGRYDNSILVVGLTFVESMSTCTSVVQPCQSQFLDGIRGDPNASPLDRRAPRRLIHCESISVSSLVHDDNVLAETNHVADDIRILGDRRNNHEYVSGSFLGRAELEKNPLTNAYREMNGEADGFPGWTVDRYDKWLLVQHDVKTPKGPIPSIHDGNTEGVYYLPSNPDRSAMGSKDVIRPILMEGKAAPDTFPILENGVTYLVSLEKDLSTGIFLDQRPQRAWLATNCNDDTRVLNCFAHCGAFSVAAATAGAQTVSLDLEKKWLDRIEPQMAANGIDFERQDCIYGDCFDWLGRLGKRGETYDIVILDPPSTSVGKKKRRWSVKKDMASLVSLAAPLVKKGGLLWTTTNNSSISSHQFARMCKKGLEEAGHGNAKLERIVPMPVDFSAIGSHPVTNLVWRLP